ncbi:MAG: hypothetical protein ACYDHM_09600 [Acidiferrobacterales bacterium]
MGKLADQGVYLASESTFYRVLKEAEPQHHRGRTQAPARRRPTSHCAQYGLVVGYHLAAVKGRYYYWYMIRDMNSRKIVGHKVCEAESADHAAARFRRTRLSERLAGRPAVGPLFAQVWHPQGGLSLVQILTVPLAA